jgi:hypothetical protein
VRDPSEVKFLKPYRKNLEVFLTDLENDELIKREGELHAKGYRATEKARDLLMPLLALRKLGAIILGVGLVTLTLSVLGRFLPSFQGMVIVWPLALTAIGGFLYFYLDIIIRIRLLRR